MQFYEIKAGNQTYKFHIGDILKSINKGKSYSHKSGGVVQDSVPYDIVNSLLSSKQLELVCKWPLEYRVIEIVSEAPKPVVILTCTYVIKNVPRVHTYEPDRFEQAKQHYFEMLGNPKLYLNLTSSYKFNLDRKSKAS